MLSDENLPKEKRVKNMIVRTNLAAESANGSTDMHSRPGKSTITSHKIFSNIHRKLPIKQSNDELRNAALLSALSYVPDKLDKELPKSEFKVDMDKLYKDLVKQVNEDKANRKDLKRLSPRAISSEVIPEATKEQTGDDEEYDFEGIPDPSTMHTDGKIKYIPGQTSSFNATDRLNKVIQTKQYGDGLSVGPIFLPNFKFL